MSDFDFVYMALGAGVQSGTLAEMIAEGELAPPDVCIFADTGDEPQYVLDYVEYITPRLAKVGVPVITVSAGNLVEDAMKPDQRFAAIPVFTLIDGKVSRLRRHCTREYKIEPIEKWVRQHLSSQGKAKLTKDHKIRLDKEVKVECWLGLSLDEIARLKPNPSWWIENQWPLVDLRMSRYDCKQWLFKHGLPIPGKSSCRI